MYSKVEVLCQNRCRQHERTISNFLRSQKVLMYKGRIRHRHTIIMAYHIVMYLSCKPLFKSFSHTLGWYQNERDITLTATSVQYCQKPLPLETYFIQRSLGISSGILSARFSFSSISILSLRMQISFFCVSIVFSRLNKK